MEKQVNQNVIESPTDVQSGDMLLGDVGKKKLDVKNFKTACALLAVILAFVAFITLFLPAITRTSYYARENMNSFNIAFGAKSDTVRNSNFGYYGNYGGTTVAADESSNILNFSFFGLMAVLAVIAAFVLNAINFFGAKQNKRLTYIAAAVSLCAFLNYFQMENNVIFNELITSSHYNPYFSQTGITGFGATCLLISGALLVLSALYESGKSKANKAIVKYLALVAGFAIVSVSALKADVVLDTTMDIEFDVDTYVPESTSILHNLACYLIGYRGGLASVKVDDGVAYCWLPLVLTILWNVAAATVLAVILSKTEKKANATKKREKLHGKALFVRIALIVVAYIVGLSYLMCSIVGLSESPLQMFNLLLMLSYIFASVMLVRLGIVMLKNAECGIVARVLLPILSVPLCCALFFGMLEADALFFPGIGLFLSAYALSPYVIIIISVILSAFVTLYYYMKRKFATPMLLSLITVVLANSIYIFVFAELGPLVIIGAILFLTLTVAFTVFTIRSLVKISREKILPADKK